MQRCPKCGRLSYEYNPNWRKYACLRTACSYVEQNNEIRLRRQKLQIKGAYTLGNIPQS